jgi:hypothetical protein
MMSTASAVPGRIKGIQADYHTRMKEANEIVEGTKFHYDYVNGIYAGNFDIAQVVVAQAKEEQLRNEQIREAIVAGASFALSFTPEGAAANMFMKIVKIAHKIDEARERLEKAAKVFDAISGSGESAEGPQGGPQEPAELQIASLEHVIDLAFSVARARDAGDKVLDGAVDLSTDIGSNAPNSGALSAEKEAALQEAQAACEELLTETDVLLDSLRQLRARRGVQIPSWREVEQDIWILYFSSMGRIPAEEVLRNHMVDIGLWGPRGQPGGRLGVAEVVEGILVKQVYEQPKTVPAHEDEKTGESVGETTMDWMQVVRADAATLPAKWARIMLLTD